MPKISNCLWFDGNALEAAQFYMTVFPNSSIGRKLCYPEGSFGEPGSLLTVEFVLDGTPFIGLNGGDVYKLSPAVSFLIHCSNQEEIDYYWEKLSDGGEIQDCGWLVDRFGVSWQVAPDILDEMMADPDKLRAQRVSDALLKMKRIDIAQLAKAYENNPA
jgi:predicted 3-demethylubiquinone-9 3-methyltransferase (glyoxalase superfamily)